MIVLLLVVDSLRADAPGFGGGEAQTPTLDGLAAGGTVYVQAIASAGWTVPSLNAIVAGTFPHRIGVSRWRHPYPSRRPTLFSAFAAAGFEIHTLVHNPRWAFANTQVRGVVGDAEEPDAILRALRTPAGSDRLVVVHHWWTHLPYRNEKIPRTPWRKLCGESLSLLAEGGPSERGTCRRRYLDTVEHLDRELLPRWLDAAGAGGDDVLVCLTADHGENWGESLPVGARVEHIYDLHGRWLTDDTTHVPLVFWGGRGSARVPAAQRLSGLARGVDVAPTLCGLAGVPWPGPLPASAGPTFIHRGIGVDGTGLQLDGLCLADDLRAGLPARATEALTVTSHNAIVPAKYPRAARAMWRRFSVRTDSARLVWDGVDRARWVQRADGGLDRVQGVGAFLRGALLGGGALASRMAAERRAAIGPGPTLPKALFPGLEEDEGELDGAEVSPSDLAERLATLGYAD